MKATLTIEVPDDFEKGEHEKCELAPTNVAWCLHLADRCSAENCPLEIQEKSMTKPNLCRVECKVCSYKEVCGYVNKE